MGSRGSQSAHHQIEAPFQTNNQKRKLVHTRVIRSVILGQIIAQHIELPSRLLLHPREVAHPGRRNVDVILAIGVLHGQVSQHPGSGRTHNLHVRPPLDSRRSAFIALQITRMAQVHIIIDHVDIRILTVWQLEQMHDTQSLLHCRCCVIEAKVIPTNESTIDTQTILKTKCTSVSHSLCGWQCTANHSQTTRDSEHMGIRMRIWRYPWVP